MKVLIVDDNEESLYLLRAFLERSGYEVLSALNGAEALEKARTDPPDLIISDILMPGMDGFSLCREWKHTDELKEIPFIFYTATYTDPKDEEFALSLGAEKFIRKPEEPQVFIRIVQEILRAKEAGQLVASPKPPKAEEVYLRQYNEALVRKLETKMVQLEETHRALKRKIEERKQAEEVLRESEERYRALVESSSEHIFMLSGEGIYLSSNSQVKPFGLERGELLVGRHLRDVYPLETAQFYQRKLEQVFATGQPIDFEHPMVEAGDQYYHLDTLYPIYRGGKYGLWEESAGISPRRKRRKKS